MRSRYSSVLAVVVLALITAASAVAAVAAPQPSLPRSLTPGSRPSRGDEATRIARVVDGASFGCLWIRVSTVDPSWAVATMLHLQPRCQNLEAGYVVARRVHSRWTFVGSGDGIESHAYCDMFGPTPVDVAVGLGLCATGAPMTGSNTTLTCVVPGSTLLNAKRRPRACKVAFATAPGAGSVELVQLGWSDWGKSTATATGELRVAGQPDEPVAVSASASKPNDCGGYAYTLLTIRSSLGTTTTHDIPDCVG